MSRRLILIFLLFLAVASGCHAHVSAESSTPAGSITGTVTDQVTGQPTPNVSVYACLWGDGTCRWYRDASTDAAGRYRLTGLPEAEYKVCFIRDAYAKECYDDWPYDSAGTRINVGPDEAVTGIDAALAPLARIRGRAVDATTGKGVPNALVAGFVWFMQREWHEIRTAVTDEDGRYELSGLEGDTYRLRFSADGYATRFYRAGRTVDDAVDVGVGTGQTVQGGDMAMQLLGRIAGQATNQAGQPLSAITVTAISELDVRTSTTTDLLGFYDVGGLEAGEYKVEFRDGPTEYEPCQPHDYGPIWYGGAQSHGEAQTVSVRLAETTSGIDQALPPVGSFRATLVDFYTGEPAAGIGVSLFPNPYAEFHNAMSDANGQVAIGSLDPGAYQAEIIGPAELYDSLWPNDIGPVVIEPGRATELRFELKSGPRIVRGRITDATTGAALEGIQVNLLGSRCHWRNGCETYTMMSVLTDAGGRFEYFNPPPDADGLAAADPGAVYDDAGLPYRYPERGETVIADAALQTVASKYGYFAGRTTDANGAPLEGATVTAYRQDAAAQYSGRTGADGTYHLRVAAGAYLLGFAGPVGYYTEVYDDQPTTDGAQVLWIAASEVMTVNAALASWGGITGTVRTETGQPLEGAEVQLYRSCGTVFCHSSSRLTGVDGRYRFTLGDGDYRIRFAAPGRDPLIWGGAARIEEGADITVAGGNYETIDATLRAGGVLEVRVTDRDTGQPVAGILVTIVGWPLTDGDGRSVIRNLPTGMYTVRPIDPQHRYPKQYYDDGRGGHAVQVMAGMTTTVAVTLQPPGRAVGRVTDTAGQPLAGIEVKVQQHCGEVWQAVTDAEGRYDSGPLVPTGYYSDDGYVVRFSDPQKRYQPEYADDSQTERETTIMPGQVLVLDATLDRLPSLSGTVKDATGAPLSEIRVWVGNGVSAAKLVYTGGDGAYLLDYVPAGPTKLVFDGCCRRYLPVTRPMTLTYNTDYAGVDAQMVPWGKLKGRVTDEATGEPIAKVWVKLYRSSTGHWTMRAATVTAADGAYAFGGLDSGTYRIEFAHPQGWYGSESYPDAPNVALAGDIAFVREADTEIDAALVRNGDRPPGEMRLRLYLPMISLPNPDSY